MLLAGNVASCSGDNSHGQLGDGSTVNRSTPGTVSQLSSVVDLAAGYLQTCAVASSGSEFCWGSNNSGQLGHGATTDSSVPVRVVGISKAITTSTGVQSSCAFSWLTRAGR